MASKLIPLTEYERQCRRQRWTLSVAVAAAVATLSLADHAGWFWYGGDDLARYHDQWFLVAAVLDGDTLELASRDGQNPTTRVRLWGIDAPETAKDWLNQPAQPWADQAADLLRQLCEHQRVRLELEPHRVRDGYDRLLAHVQLADGRYANEVMLAAGLARADDRWEHQRLSRYQLLQRQARHDRVGLWTSVESGIVTGD